MIADPLSMGYIGGMDVFKFNFWACPLVIILLLSSAAFARADSGDSDSGDSASLVCSGAAKAELLPAETATAAFKGVEEFYKALKTLRSSFVQHSYFLGLDQMVTSKGELHFKRPGLMRWDYREPEKQLFVSDGEKVYFYQPQLKQVSVGEFKEAFSSELPVSFLLGIAKLSENFSLESACRNTSGILLNLSPKNPDPNLSRLSLLVAADNYRPLAFKVVDIGANETTILLPGATFGGELEDALFSFAIPKGVDVLGYSARTVPSS